MHSCISDCFDYEFPVVHPKAPPPQLFEAVEFEYVRYLERSGKSGVQPIKAILVDPKDDVK